MGELHKVIHIRKQSAEREQVEERRSDNVGLFVFDVGRVEEPLRKKKEPTIEKEKGNEDEETDDVSSIMSGVCRLFGIKRGP